MTDPLRVACIGMGWWSDVLADAFKRSSRLKIVACYSREQKRRPRREMRQLCVPKP
jgi:predicted dehydrogenase